MLPTSHDPVLQLVVSPCPSPWGLRTILLNHRSNHVIFLPLAHTHSCACTHTLTNTEFFNCCQPGFLAFPQSIEIDQRPEEKFRQGFIRAPACLLLEGEASFFLLWDQSRVCPWVRPEGLRWPLGDLLSPPGGIVYKEHVQYSVFAPNPLALL